MFEPTSIGRASFGLVEGFYGRPWTWPERIEVTSHLAAQGVAQYVWAPKDDHKHRARWRERFDREELGGFRHFVERTGGAALAPAAHQRGRLGAE